MKLRHEVPERVFHEELSRALRRVKATVSQQAHEHLIRVLAAAVRDVRFREAVLYSPLSVQYNRALAFPEKERVMLLREVGDAAYLVCSFWWRQKTQGGRLLDREYYIELGRAAYRRIGEEPFKELAAKYPELTTAATLVAQALSATPSEDILALYELWQSDRSRWAVRVLALRGIGIGSNQSQVPS